MLKVIANTTPLIALANIGALNLLQKIYGEIIIPPAVVQEIKSEPAKTSVAASEWIRVCSIKNGNKRNLYKSRLHAGEVEVMILAEEQSADLLLMDDKAAKKTAKFMGYNVTGTLGVLLRAKREAHIEEIKPLLEKLVFDGMFISDGIIRLTLAQAKEL